MFARDGILFMFPGNVYLLFIVASNPPLAGV